MGMLGLGFLFGALAAAFAPPANKVYLPHDFKKLRKIRDAAVKEEKYELAALCRDKLKEMGYKS